MASSVAAQPCSSAARDQDTCLNRLGLCEIKAMNLVLGFSLKKPALRGKEKTGPCSSTREPAKDSTENINIYLPILCESRPMAQPLTPLVRTDMTAPHHDYSDGPGLVCVQ